MDCFIIINKSAGRTSNDIVHRMKRLLKEFDLNEKVGHTGTLDPFATGVLPICVGKATKQSGKIVDGDKEYLATLQLGLETDTGDITGKCLSQCLANLPSLDEIEEAIKPFLGHIQQATPSFSAVKWKGKALYKHARAGVKIPEIKRSIEIKELVLLGSENDTLSFRVKCSKGTYIRALLPDIAKSLGTIGTVQSLRRTQCGPFLLQNSAPFDEFESAFRELDRSSLTENKGELGFTGLPGYASLRAL